ncbi:MAG: hypothetical protein U9N07_07565 [Euryarchaeota archaeon]|nr:hypothetical protein [Euryarchaeota archaeon]
MERKRCIICHNELDSTHYAGYDICTECFDLMEDLMSEYFLRTITRKGTGVGEMYSKYLKDSIEYVTDYKRIREKSKRYFKDVKDRLETAVETEAGPRQRYLERMLLVLEWLQNNPTFYNYYFKEYYSCPTCGASIFEHYEKQMVGDWLMITCSRCDAVIKKYFLPGRI